MADRLVDLWVPPAHVETVRARVAELDEAAYEQLVGEDAAVFRLVVPAGKVEPLLDELGSLTEGDRPVRAVVVSVAALCPRLEVEEEDDDSDGNGGDDEDATDRVSRDELYSTLKDRAEITPSFVVMTMLSAIVAAVGVSRDSAAVVIGAMVIAPLLGPNMALALSTTLADGALAVRALLANALGLGVAIATALLAGLVFGLDLDAHEVSGRTTVTLGEIVLALASGAAGALAATRGAAQSLVGVMVAVALLPPVVIAAMLAVQGHAEHAARATLLVVGNIVCINLAAVTVFRLRGIRPRTWYEGERARRTTIIALVVWFVLLASIVALVLWTGAPAEKPADETKATASVEAPSPELARAS